MNGKYRITALFDEYIETEDIEGYSDRERGWWDAKGF